VNERNLAEIVYSAIVTGIGENFKKAEFLVDFVEGKFSFFLTVELPNGSTEEMLTNSFVEKAVVKFYDSAAKTNGSVLDQALFVFTGDGDYHSSLLYSTHTQ